MHGKRVRLGPHFLQRGLSLAKRYAKVIQCILKPICPHTVQLNITRKRSILFTPCALSDWISLGIESDAPPCLI